jgi:hypothetical protein
MSGVGSFLTAADVVVYDRIRARLTEAICSTTDRGAIDALRAEEALIQTMAVTLGIVGARARARARSERVLPEDEFAGDTNVRRLYNEDR